MSAVNLVVVYLGRKTPKYVFANLQNLREKFKKQDIYFISDNLKSLKKAKKFGILVFQCSNIISKNKSLKDKSSHPMKFRDGFWFQTIARFIAMEEFILSNPGPLLQVEADVWLSDQFPLSAFSKLSKSKNLEIAFTLQNSQTGSASILWIRDAESVKKLNAIARDSIEKDGQSTDMTILGRIFNENLMQHKILPSTRVKPESNEPETSVSNLLLETSKNFLEFGGLFDPLTYGMYLLGDDPNNGKGTKKIYNNITNHIIAPRNLNFLLENNTLSVYQNNSFVPIYCLHNHSKDIKLFDIKKEMKLLNYRVVNDRKTSKSEFVLSVYLKLAIRYFLRKFTIYQNYK